MDQLRIVPDRSTALGAPGLDASGEPPAGGPPRRAAFHRPRLTPGEREVVDYVCLGYTNREIAAAMGLSPFTVRNRLVLVFRKLGATTRAELVRVALTGA
jgi:DNA-binding CsgD family transcriptional regulator